MSDTPPKIDVRFLRELLITEGWPSVDYVVRAVNSHEELLKACKDALATFNQIYPGQVKTGPLEKAIAKAEVNI